MEECSQILNRGSSQNISLLKACLQRYERSSSIYSSECRLDCGLCNSPDDIKWFSFLGFVPVISNSRSNENILFLSSDKVIKYTTYHYIFSLLHHI